MGFYNLTIADFIGYYFFFTCSCKYFNAAVYKSKIRLNMKNNNNKDHQGMQNLSHFEIPNIITNVSGTS